MPIVGVVLAGGRSSRFGRDKALLTLGGETLLQRTVATMRAATNEVIVIGPPERAGQVAGVVVLQDATPGIGPLGGIHTALGARPGCAVLVVAVDMPFLNAELLAQLCRLSTTADVVLPIVDGRSQQLHAVYGPACVAPIVAQIEMGDYKIDRFFSAVRVRRVEEDELRPYDPDLKAFRNVNTPESWQTVLAELAPK